MAAPVAKIAATSSEQDPYAALLSAWNSLSPALLGSGVTTQTDTSGLDPDMAALVKGMLGQSNSDVASGAYSKDQAIKDSSGQIQQIIKDGLQKNMPSIGGAAHGAGLYNDTTTKLLSNDLQARLAAQAAAAVQSNITNYANIQNAATQNTVNAAKALGSTSTSTKQTAPIIPPAASGSVLGGVLGAAQLAKLANGTGIGKKIKDLFGSDPSDTAGIGYGVGDTGAMDSGIGGFGDFADSPTFETSIGSGSDLAAGEAASEAGGDFDGVSSFFGSSSDGGGGFGDFFDSLGGSAAADIAGGGFDTADALSSASDIANGIDTFSNSSDIGGNIADASAGLGDLGDASDLGSSVGDAASEGGGFLDGISDWFDDWFADGGRVATPDERVKAMAQMKAQSNSGSKSNKSSNGGTKKKTHYADGGRVAPSNIYSQQQLDAAAARQAQLATPTNALTQQAPPPVVKAPVVVPPKVTPAKTVDNTGEASTYGDSYDPTNVFNSGMPANISNFNDAGGGSGAKSGLMDNGSDSDTGSSNGSFGQFAAIAMGMAKIAMGNPLGLADVISGVTTGKSVIGNASSAILGALGFGNKNPLDAAQTSGVGSDNAYSDFGGGVPGDEPVDSQNSDLSQQQGSGNSGGDSGADSGIEDDGGLGDTSGSGNSGGDMDTTPPQESQEDIDAYNSWLIAWQASGGQGSPTDPNAIGGSPFDGGIGGDPFGGNGGSGSSTGNIGGDDFDTGYDNFDQFNYDNFSSTGGYKNGGSPGRTPSGKMPGHDTAGKDKIKIHVSGGEYVMPTDVVDHLGVDFFDKIKDMFHKPLKEEA